MAMNKYRTLVKLVYWASNLKLKIRLSNNGALWLTRYFQFNIPFSKSQRLKSDLKTLTEGLKDCCFI